MKKTKKVTKCTAGVSELKASLSAYLARVKAGEEVVVTERGTPVAKLIPMPRDEGSDMAHLRDLERRGLLRIGTGRLSGDFWERPMPEDPEGLVLKGLLEERRAGR